VFIGGCDGCAAGGRGRWERKLQAATTDLSGGGLRCTGTVRCRSAALAAVCVAAFGQCYWLQGALVGGSGEVLVKMTVRWPPVLSWALERLWPGMVYVYPPTLNFQ